MIQPSIERLAAAACLWLGTCLAAEPETAAPPAQTEKPEHGSGFYVGAGAAYRSGMDVRLRRRGTRPNSGGNFDDGYVRPDAMTPLFGDTTDWAFTRPSQYDAAAQTLTYTSTGGGCSDDSNGTGGGDLFTGWPFLESDRAALALELHLTWYATLDETLGADTVRTVYSTSQIEADAPGYFDAVQSGTSAPWGAQGSDNGPALPATPESVLHARDRYRLEVDLQQLRLGPRGSWRVTDRLTLEALPYGSLSRIEAEAEGGRAQTDGTVTRSHAEKTRCEPGFGLELGLSFLCTDRLCLFATGGYDWICNEPALTLGNDRLSYDLDAWQATFGVRLAL